MRYSEIKLRNETIELSYQDYCGSSNFVISEIDIGDVMIVGAWRTMYGDDDTTFLIMIARNGERHMINLQCLENEDKFEESRDLFAELYSIEIYDFYEVPTVLYPAVLSGNNIFHHSLWFKIKRMIFVSNDYLVNSKLSLEVAQYLDDYFDR